MSYFLRMLDKLPYELKKMYYKLVEEVQKKYPDAEFHPRSDKLAPSFKLRKTKRFSLIFVQFKARVYLETLRIELRIPKEEIVDPLNLTCVMEDYPNWSYFSIKSGDNDFDYYMNLIDQSYNWIKKRYNIK